MQTLVVRPESCVNLRGKTLRVCLPGAVFCSGDNEIGGLITELGDTWCDLCAGDERYAMPYLRGDVIHLQTHFYDSYNANRRNPESGFGTFVRAYVSDGKSRQEITAGMVAFGNNKSYQVLKVDTAQILMRIWAVEFEIYNRDGTIRRTLQSEQFEEVDERICRTETILVEGHAEDGEDCFGNVYGPPDTFTGEEITYSNAMRFYANVFPIGGSIEKKSSTGLSFNAETIEFYRFKMLRKIPPYLFRVLMKQMLPAPELRFNEEKYDLNKATPDNEVVHGRMFYFDITVERVCKGGGCN